MGSPSLKVRACSCTGGPTGVDGADRGGASASEPSSKGSQDVPIPRTPGDDSAVGSPMLPDRPAYDDLLDAALEYTFPASDPISVDSGCARIDATDKA